MKLFRTAQSHNLSSILFFHFIVLIFLQFSAHAEIRINEFLSSTNDRDEFGTPLEWIEIYNSGNETVNLLGYTLSDDPLAPGKWMFGAAEIPAKGFLRIWATGYDLLDRNNYHTNFRLNKDGEILALYRPDGIEEDAINYPIQRSNVSYGRYPNGGDEWFYFTNPTPAQSNENTGIVGFLEKPQFSVEGGIYSTSISLELSSDAPGAEIRYTLDGSEPLETSEQYRTPISIADTVLVRARIFQEDFVPSPIATHSYIFRESMTLPILSLVAEPDDLYSRSSGIYSNPENHGQAWERPVSVEYFTKDGERAFQEHAGIRIHGGASRSRSPKKSFRLYFRSEYGATRLEYPLFPNAGVDRSNQIVIRGGFNDTWGYDSSSQRGTAIYVSDQVARDLQKDMGQLASDGIFLELYVNGENWGVYNPSERIEEDYFEQHTGIEGWTVIADGSEVKDGDRALWDDCLQWVNRVSFPESGALETLNEVVDAENFTAFLILNIWLQNYDWPRHNWLCARANNDSGRWKFLAWDVEYSFGSGMSGYRVDINVYNYLEGNGSIGALFSKLSRTTEYREYFWQQVNHYLNTALSEENVMNRLNARLAEIRDAIPWEAEKWGEAKGGDPERTPDDWEAAAQLARDFVAERTAYFIQHTVRVVGPRPVSVMDWQMY